MTTAVLKLSKIQNKLRAKAEAIDFPQINWKLVCGVGFVVIFTLLVFYVLQINSLAKGSYLINNYEKKYNRLNEENKNLEANFAESSFLGQTLVKINALNFQKTTSVKYIKIPESSVAIKK